jgi:2-polyprenyl-3-methyl-5-hydroxy-6-metoxy-1,4-benzoquinol methylase
LKTNYHQKFYEINAGISSNSAVATLGALLEVYRAKSLLDVGCGIGTWGKAGKGLGFAKYRGVDGDYVRRDQLMIDRDEFTAHDLRQPLALNEQYDLAICMEVAEHLPPEAAGTLIRSLCAHAPVVLFSAAIPLQGGVDHVNEQWQSYWANLFSAAGYEVFDCIRPRVWGCDQVAEYYKQNALVYVNRENTTLLSRFKADAMNRSVTLNLVHPETYQIKANPKRWPLPVVLKNLPAIVLRVIRNRIFAK